MSLEMRKLVNAEAQSRREKQESKGGLSAPLRLCVKGFFEGFEA